LLQKSFSTADQNFSSPLMGFDVARILKGEKAAILPVQVPTKYRLGINLKTASSICQSRFSAARTRLST